MDADQLFEVANLIAMAGWVCLLFSPVAPRVTNYAAAIAVPAVLAVAYVGLFALLLVGGSGGEDAPPVDFSSLDGVTALFSVREAVLVGWIHYLAFDLFVGAWEVRTARREGIAFVLVVPCLVLTLFAGPAGFLLFLLIRALNRRHAPAPA